jgi:hypothetical protein
MVGCRTTPPVLPIGIQIRCAATSAVLLAAELMTLIDALLLAAGAVLILHAVEAAYRWWR